MISRQWHGIVKAGFENAYIRHLQVETFPAMRNLPGFLGVSILRRAVSGGTQFLIVSRWESLDAIHAFAGERIESAVVPHKARDMMVSFDQSVRHYEIVDQNDAG